MDTITSIQFNDGRVYINVSDGSVIQFELSDDDIDSLRQESSAMKGAEIINVVNTGDYFQLDYRTTSGRDRTISFNY